MRKSIQDDGKEWNQISMESNKRSQGSNNAPASRDALAKYTTSTRIQTASPATTRKGRKEQTQTLHLRYERKEQTLIRATQTLYPHERKE